MEKMEGIDREIGDRILFYSGRITDKTEKFFLDRGLLFLYKPAPIETIRKTVAGLVRLGTQERRKTAT